MLADRQGPDAGSYRGTRPSLVAIVGATLLVMASAVYLVTGIQQNLVVAKPGFTNAIGNGIGTDFPAFYAAGREAAAGRAAATYDLDTLRAAHQAVRDVPVKPYSWAYPPTMFLAMAPLARLPLVPALWMWLVGTLGVLVVAAWRLVPSPLTPLAVLLFPGVTTSLVTGPTGTFSAAVFAAGVALLAARRPAWAGAALGCLTVKPHLAALVLLCLLAGGERRALVAFLGSAAALVAGSIAAFGVEPWRAFLEALPRHMSIVAAEHVQWSRMPTAFVAVRHAIGSTTWAWSAQIATSAAVAAVAAWGWRRTASLATRTVLLAAAMPLLGPYSYDYDTCMLIVPIVLLGRDALGDGAGRIDVAAIVLLWLTPVALWLVSAALGQQIGPLLLATAIAYGVRRVRRGS